MEKPKRYVYPTPFPVGNDKDAGLDALGAYWNKGGEGITPWIDYICFSFYRPQYDGKAILESIREDKKSGEASKSTDNPGDSIYLYMPANVAISYSASYNNTKFGVGGLAAAQMLGSGSNEETAKTLQTAAAGATPEAGFKAVAEASNSISNFIGVEGSISASDLAAVSQGKIFNPYEEQVFNGITFRAHQFQFKLVARNKKEAEEIDSIIKSFKRAMLPSYDQKNSLGTGVPASAPPKEKSAKDSTSKDTPADALTPPFSNIKNRYLNVPSRAKVNFYRVYTAGAAKAVELDHLYKFKDCVIDGFQANYTPDGGYVNTNDGYVPAIDISVSLKEIALVTAEDINQGY